MANREVILLIWNREIDEIVSGYYESEGKYVCLMCGSEFAQGRIYPIGEELYDAQGAVRRHVQGHGGVADFLLNQELSLTGLSEVQRQLLQLVAAGRSDAEIAKAMGIAQSTVRNHRFKLREKEKQAKMFLALMKAMERQTKNPIGHSDGVEIVEVPPTARMVDDRYGITAAEKKKTIETYFDRETGALKQFPAREKKKIIVLCEIVKNFKPGQAYSEAEVNRVLKRIFEMDYVSIRRYLIEYGFMDRSDDCSVYRVKE